LWGLDNTISEFWA